MKIKDHTTQRAYIERTMGRGGFWLFYKERGKYKWKWNRNYDNKLFMYKGIFKNFNPEVRGRFTNEIFTKIENTVEVVTSPIIGIDSPETYNQKLDYGIHILARYDAPHHLSEKNIIVYDNFTEIVSSIKKNCELYISDKVIEETNLQAHQENRFIQIDMGNIVNSTISYQENYLLISESSILYHHNMMAYPLTSNLLFCPHDKSHEPNNKVIDTLRNYPHAWIDYVCRKTNLYLIAHETIPLKFRDCMEELYNKGTYSLIEST